MARPSSVLCPSCGTLVGVNDPQCLNCGRRYPGMFGFAHVLRGLGDDMGFTPLVMFACGALYLATLAVNPEAVGTSGLLSFLSPSVPSVFLFGASGAVPVFGAGRWWTVLSAGWLHGGILHIALDHRCACCRQSRAFLCGTAQRPHRDAAFAACAWLMDELKKTAPIWKKEIYRDGTRWQKM